MLNLDRIALNLRIDILKMIYAAEYGNLGVSFAVIDILVVLYFGGFIQVDPQNPKKQDRDIFVMSDSRCSPALYSILGQLGYIDSVEFFRFCQADGILQADPTKDVPGIEYSCGLPGNGASYAVGNGIIMQQEKKETYTYVLLTEDELGNENVLEAIVTAVSHKLENTIFLVVHFGISDDFVKKIENVKTLGIEIVPLFEGNSTQKISESLHTAKKTKNLPTLITCNTQIACGINPFEGKNEWLNQTLTDADFEEAHSILIEKTQGLTD